MNKKLLSILLILTMVVFIFTGCGKKDSGGDTSLEGTWLLQEEHEIETVDGFIDKDNTDVYPLEESGDEKLEGMTYMLQPYYKFKSGVFSAIMELDFEENSLDLDKVLVKLYEGTYSVIGDKLTISFIDEDEEEIIVENIYVISDKTMVTTLLKERDNVSTEVTAKFIKVPDSEVDGAIDYEEFIKNIE